MFYGETIQETRQPFFSTWEKYQQKNPLSPLEDEILQVILAHPEYHKVLDNQNKYQEQTQFPELDGHNPFLHMGLHIAVREQVFTDRPKGINSIFKALLTKYQDPLNVEHLIMEQLVDRMWGSALPNEQEYLEALAIL